MVLSTAGAFVVSTIALTFSVAAFFDERERSDAKIVMVGYDELKIEAQKADGSFDPYSWTICEVVLTNKGTSPATLGSLWVSEWEGVDTKHRWKMLG